MRNKIARTITALAALAALTLGGAVAVGVAQLIPERPVPASDGPAGRFPAPPDTDRAVVWAVGDGADEGVGSRAVARLISSGDPVRFLYLGDVYEGGSAQEFRANYAAIYGPLKDITLPTPGNHDWPRHAEGYDSYFFAAALASGRALGRAAVSEVGDGG